MDKWQYKLVYAHWESVEYRIKYTNGTVRSLEQDLEWNGDHGWELVNVVAVHFATSGSCKAKDLDYNALGTWVTQWEPHLYMSADNLALFFKRQVSAPDETRTTQ